jgi:hypothetical protein
VVADAVVQVACHAQAFLGQALAGFGVAAPFGVVDPAFRLGQIGLVVAHGGTGGHGEPAEGGQRQVLRTEPS